MLDDGVNIDDAGVKISWRFAGLPGTAALTYRFERFELDPGRFELRADGEARHVEPQVLSLLLLLAANPDRLVSRDEIVEKIWDGRIISESAISARIKAARQAIDDDGTRQRLIRTVHGRGFRFVGKVEFRGEAAAAAPVPSHIAATAPAMAEAQGVDPVVDLRRGRPSIAVLPFEQLGEALPQGIVADALPAEIIMDLSRLRWLFVIARGSSFRFRGSDIDIRSVGRTLGVRYCLTGTIERAAPGEVTIGVTLAETAEGGVIWADRYRGSLADWPALRREIESQVVGNLDVQIRQNEAKLARWRDPAGLDAWSTFHLGLDHMFRFNRADNLKAAEFFRRSLAVDSDFSSALGGLSFTHFQNAFLGYAGEREGEVEQARLLAHRAVESDRLDPFAHFNLARSFWIEGNLAESIEWFDRVRELSPNFAQGVYNRGLVAVLAGEAKGAEDDLELAIQLSPLDPLRYAMISGRALGRIQSGDFELACVLAERAALTPGAHKHIELIAAVAAHLAGDSAREARWLQRALARDPALCRQAFFTAFPFAQTQGRETIERALAEMGL